MAHTHTKDTLRNRKKHVASPDSDNLSSFDRVVSNDCQPNRRNTTSFETDPENADHRWSGLKNNPLSGITFYRLILLLWLKHRSIDWWRYSLRIFCLLLMSVVNQILEFIEWVYMRFFLSRSSAPARPSKDPIFVIGHPRTGTTLLHSLFGMDSQFIFCNTFCAGFPHCFLWFESIGKRLFAPILSKTRPMDNMNLHFDLPQEDELATCLLTGGRCSPYMTIYFPRDDAMYQKYQTFNDSSHEDTTIWVDAFQYLLKKLNLRDNKKGQQLVLKTPSHTGRIRLFLKLFPNAKFVHIHRHPLEVFLSATHMANTTYGYCFLQQPLLNHNSSSCLKEFVLRQYEILLGEYWTCVDEGLLVKGKNWVDVGFDELTEDPTGCVQHIYNELGIELTEDFQCTLKAYCDQHFFCYKRNKFDASSVKSEIRKELRARWEPYYRRWGYTV